ncbi:MAG: RNA polymerase factor sigma-54 [Verrucomicrobiota bacterium]
MSDLYLHQGLSQHQTLAPQMRKSLEILQANSLELSQLLRQSLEANPTLEDVTEISSLDEDGPDSEEGDSLARLNDTDDDWRERAIYEGRNITWSQDDEERRQYLYESIVAPVSLQSHLKQQLDLSLVEPETREAAELILGNLDERGFLDLPLRELTSRFGLTAETLQKSLELVRSFDPPGIGAESIAESLLFQIERAGGKNDIEYRIVRDHLEDLAKKRHPIIAKVLGVSIERVNEAASNIGKLTLNPGGDFDPTGNPYIQPDVIVEYDDDGRLTARLTGEYLPQLRINDFYKNLIGKDGIDSKARNFLRDQIRDGRSLIRSISLRQETILAITYKLIKKQGDFFHKGPRFLRPLTMNEIADELDLHATTVSRAVAGKYIRCPQGLMEMRAFFATGYQTSDGQEVSNAGVREALLQIVAEEDASKPFSDDALMKALAKQGIKVARRTIAKYREQLNILPSHLRKSH